MSELGPTSMIDPFVQQWAREAGMPAKQLSSIVGGNFMGATIVFPLDMFLTELGSKLVSVALGGLGLFFGTYNLPRGSRMQLDTMQISTRLITEILAMSPQQIKETQQKVGSMVEGAINGRWDKMLYAIIRDPRELASLIPSQNKEKAADTTKKTEKETPEPAETPSAQEQPASDEQAGIVYKL